MRSLKAPSSFPFMKATVIALISACLCPRTLAFTRTVLESQNHQRILIQPLKFSIEPSEASLLAGGLGGICGVGLSFPLDTLKTRIQLSSYHNPMQEIRQQSHKNLHIVEEAMRVYESEGLSGFFEGVQTTMFGQGVVKSVAFFCNAYALHILQGSSLFPNQVPSFSALILAACFAGFVVSFLVVPIERIKVESQSKPKFELHAENDLINKDFLKRRDEINCARAIIQREGLEGLFLCGIGLTLAREIPSYAIDFATYRALMNSPIVASLAFGSCTSLICGAIAGCICWIPVYPIDMVKTCVQQSNDTPSSGIVAESKKCAWHTTRILYQNGGINSFYRGLFPVLIKSALSHSITFSVYDSFMTSLKTSGLCGNV